MKFHNRKLLLFDDVIKSPPPPPPMTIITTVDTSSQLPTAVNPARYSHPFDSSMGLTFLVLLIALFFMGFFSIYIRRFPDQNTTNPAAGSRYRRYWGPRVPSSSLSQQTANNRQSMSSLSRGADAATVRSLPVYSYDGDGAVKYQSECLICLGEFEDREVVKTIPFCAHVFHVQCIDRWLASHVTCPVCRGRQFFKVRKSSELDLESTVDNYDTSTHHVVVDVERLGMRKTSSCSNLGESVSLLHRTFSF